MTTARLKAKVAQIKFVARPEGPADNPTRLNFAIEISGLRLLADARQIAEPYLLPSESGGQSKMFSISGSTETGYTVIADDQSYDCRWAFLRLIGRLNNLEYKEIKIDEESLREVARVGEKFLQSKKGSGRWFEFASQTTPALGNWPDLIEELGDLKNKIRAGLERTITIMPPESKASYPEVKVAPFETAVASKPDEKKPINGYLIAGIALFALFLGVAIAVFASGGLAAAALALAPFLTKAGAIVAISITGLGSLGGSVFFLSKSKIHQQITTKIPQPITQLPKIPPPPPARVKAKTKQSPSKTPSKSPDSTKTSSV